jgi:ATP-dependent protease ClpP protease subunit
MEFKMYGPVGYWPVSSTELARQTKDLKAGDELKIFINSPGGSYVEGIAIAGELKKLIAAGVDVQTVAMGECSSAATMPFLVPKPEKRHVNQGSLLLFHRPSSGAWGFEEDLSFEVKTLNAMTKEVVSIYSDRLNKTETEVVKMLTENGTVYMANDLASQGIAQIYEGEDAVDSVVMQSNAEMLKKVLMQQEQAGPEELPTIEEEAVKTEEELLLEGRKMEAKRRKEMADLCPPGYEKELEEALLDYNQTPEGFATIVAKAERDARQKFAGKLVEIEQQAVNTEQPEEEPEKEMKAEDYIEEWKGDKKLQQFFFAGPSAYAKYKLEAK